MSGRGLRALDAVAVARSGAARPRLSQTTEAADAGTVPVHPRSALVGNRMAWPVSARFNRLLAEKNKGDFGRRRRFVARTSARNPR